MEHLRFSIVGTFSPCIFAISLRRVVYSKEFTFEDDSSVLIFICFPYSILRSAQQHHASLKPAYPGSLTYCTCGFDVDCFSNLVVFRIQSSVLLMMFMIVNAPVPGR